MDYVLEQGQAFHTVVPLACLAFGQGQDQQGDSSAFGGDAVAAVAALTSVHLDQVCTLLEGFHKKDYCNKQSVFRLALNIPKCDNYITVFKMITHLTLRPI